MACLLYTSRKALAHEFLEEAAVFRGEGFRGFLLEHVGGAQEHAQELGDQFGVGVAELLVAHEHGGQALSLRHICR